MKPFSGKTIRATLVAAVSALSVSACVDKELVPVEAEFRDPIRHYYPVIQGETLGISYEIENKSDDPLFIQEIQTTCGCIVALDELPFLVLPNRTATLHLSYNTIKNTGFVEHYVWLYGNFVDSTYRELQFDTNVVPNADYTRDYEVLWHEKQTKTGSMRDFVDGDSSEKGYFTDETGDPRDNNRERIQKKLDSHAF
ncbi:MAG: DUF1573 domain-containing protein [Muribaculaceae bacterium]|nr:DUF1573 domain-containing protein [Muribaculaceae bacterium]